MCRNRLGWQFMKSDNIFMRFKIAALVSCAILIPSSSFAQGVRPITMRRVSFTIGSGQGSAVFAPHLTPMNRSAKVGIQFVFQYVNQGGKFSAETVNAETEDGPLILDLQVGRENTFKIKLPLPPGRYVTYNMILCYSPDGKQVDYHKPVYDMDTDPTMGMQKVNMTIRGARKLLLPLIQKKDEPVITPAGNGYTVAVNAEVTLPENYTNDRNGIWAVAKGATGMSRQFLNLNNAVEADEGGYAYKKIPVRFQFGGVKPSVWSVELGLARPNDPTEMRWAEGRAEFEVGGEAWKRPAPALAIPKRVQVKNRKFVTLDGQPADLYRDMPDALSGVKFIRGGNYGNSICWTIVPAQNRPEYFQQLYDFGLRFVRINFHPDRYLEEELYRAVVDQFVQNVWSARMYPIISPQDFPKAKTDPLRVELTVRLLKMMATKYKDQPVWYHILNEPYIFQTWEKWKPAATRFVKAIRSIDPDAFVIVPFEGWAVDGRGAAVDPIRDVRVDLYDAHAYISPADFNTRYGPAVRAGLPVLVGEYGGGTATYLSQMDTVIQNTPGIVAIAPWAFTVPGMDFLALIESSTENGLTFTETGKAIQADYRTWNSGRKK